MPEDISSTKVNEDKLGYFHITSGVPQDSVLGPLLHVLYTSDLPSAHNKTTGSYADFTEIFTTPKDPYMACKYIEEHLNQLKQWLQKWRIKLNQMKSARVTFILRKDSCPPVSRNKTTETPQSDVTNYLGLYLDSTLTWKHHILKMKNQNALKTR